MLALVDVSKNFGTSFRLAPISFRIAPLETVALCGPSGCGKTTVLRLLLGLEHPSEGKIYFNEKLLSDNKLVIQPDKRNIAAAFQEPRLWQQWSVSENLRFAAASIPKKDRATHLRAVAEWTGISPLLEKKASCLSGGQAKRVSFARALAAKRPLLLLDEPFAHLDPLASEELFRAFLKAKNSWEFAAIWVSHDASDLEKLNARRIAVTPAQTPISADEPSILRPAN